MASPKEEMGALKILIIDDTHEARTMLKNMLGTIGITQIFEASDGKEGMRFLDTAFDFVDIRPPLQLLT